MSGQVRVSSHLPALSPPVVEAAGASSVVVRPGGPHTFDPLYIRTPRAWLVVLLAAYLVGGALYAYFTPAWQLPDEPAHYNYVAHIVATGALPVLAAADYDQEYISVLLQNKFPRKLPVAPLRYESYQPPLYYLLLTPIFWATEGSLLALRLMGVLLGAGTVLLLYLCLELVFPGKTLIPLGAAAFAALLPMHMAMSASVNNDTLAELLIAATLLALLGWMRGQFYAPAGTAGPRRGALLGVGLLLGLGMATKIYAYLLAPLALLLVVAVVWLRPRVGAPALQRVQTSPTRAGLGRGLAALLWVLPPMLLLAAPLWARNLLLYGGWDVLGLQWHDAVVVGQPRTTDWIADVGWMAYSERAFSFTFQSFWGVFGWMSVFMDARIYTALLIFTGVIFMGVLWATVRFISGGSDTDMDGFQLAVLLLMAAMLALVMLGYFVYNMKFVQHQGRYFFWGLLPISTVVALGWREVMQPLQGVITGLLALVMAAATAFSGSVTGAMNKWTVLTIGVFALLLLCQPLLLAGTRPEGARRGPGWWVRGVAHPLVGRLLRQGRRLAWALPFVLLLLLNLAIPHWFILPQLGN